MPSVKWHDVFRIHQGISFLNTWLMFKWLYPWKVEYLILCWQSIMSATCLHIVSILFLTTHGQKYNSYCQRYSHLKFQYKRKKIDITYLIYGSQNNFLSSFTTYFSDWHVHIIHITSASLVKLSLMTTVYVSA